MKNMNATLTPEKEMVPIRMAMDIEVIVEMIVTMQLRRSHDHSNRIYHHVSKNNINTNVILAVDSVAQVVVHQPTIRLVGTVLLPAIIIRTIKKAPLSANHTKHVITHTLKTATSSNSWARHRKYDDIHPMK